MLRFKTDENKVLFHLKGVYGVDTTCCSYYSHPAGACCTNSLGTWLFGNVLCCCNDIAAGT